MAADKTRKGGGDRRKSLAQMNAGIFASRMGTESVVDDIVVDAEEGAANSEPVRMVAGPAAPVRTEYVPEPEEPRQLAARTERAHKSLKERNMVQTSVIITKSQYDFLRYMGYMEDTPMYQIMMKGLDHEIDLYMREHGIRRGEEPWNSRQ